MKPQRFFSFLLLLTVFFQLVPSAHSLSIVFPFKDVDYSDPVEAIQYLSDKKIISGYLDGTFKPDQEINRVEALKIIFLASNFKALDPVIIKPISNIKKFSDIEMSAWYIPYLETALQKNIVQGYPDNTFKPTRTVNLVESLKMLLLAKEINLNDTKVSSPLYTDAAANEWYSKYIQYAKDKKIIDADGAGKIYPEQGMTRGNFAELIYRLMYLEENKLASFPLSFRFCQNELYKVDKIQYDFWKKTFAAFHPELQVYDVGTYCQLSDKTQLVSFAHFTEGFVKPGQTMALFDERDKLLQETKGFYCPTAGDLTAPLFEALADGKVQFSCNGGDVGFFQHDVYQLDLNTFKSILLYKNTSTSNEQAFVNKVFGMIVPFA